jgi:carbon monoxide dehydrogenase subunit G
MNLSGEQQVAAPRQRVWEALNDPEVLRQCIPGCQSLDKEGDDRFNAVAEVKIGPIGARFRGTVQLSDLDAPNGYTITGQGNGGIAGNAKGGAKVRLSDVDGGTLVSYDVEAEVGGRMAQLGGPIIDATAKQLAGKFFTKFGEVVSGGAPVAAAPVAAAPVTAEAPVVATAAAPAPAAMPVVARAAAPAAFPLGWIIVTVLAIVAGFLLGRSAMADWWVVAVAALAVVCVAAGYQSGKGASS